MRKNFIIICALLFATAGGVASVAAQNQADKVYITWKALNFYPAHFAGKALPTFGTPVTVAVEVTRNGVLLDLSQADITWELDGKFLSGGRNAKTARFTAAKGSGDTHFIRVSLVQNQEVLGSSLRIPVTSPTVVIGAPYPMGRGVGGAMTLYALPFFFNISSLDEFAFSWLIDGKRLATGSDHALTISNQELLGPRIFQVVLEAVNTENLGELSSRRATYTLTP